MKSLEAYYKIDHTFCMNANEKHIEYNIDKPELYGTEYEGTYDPIDTDCKSLEEAIDCLDTIHETIKVANLIINKHVDLGEFAFLIGRNDLFTANVYYNANKHGSRCLTKDEFTKIYDYYITNYTEDND